MRISTCLLALTAFILGASWSPAEQLVGERFAAAERWQDLPAHLREVLGELSLEDPPPGYRVLDLGRYQAFYAPHSGRRGLLVTGGRFSLAAAPAGASVRLGEGDSLGALDRDGDGWHETISYTVRDERTGERFRVRDTNRDGLADVRYRPESGERFVRLGSRWLRYEKRRGSPGVLRDGRWTRLRGEPGRFRLEPAEQS